MKHLDLFSGIGGFSLACDWLDIETICFCEIDKFCQKVLKKHWPDVPIVEDVNNVEEIKRIIADSKSIGMRRGSHGGTNGRQTDWLDPYDSTLILTAGFPCQPFSHAGRRKGSADDRYFWPQTLAVIEAVKPDWVLLENVAGILSMVFPDSGIGVASQASFCDTPNDEIADYDTISGRIERDLRQAGYETVWLVIPACSINAPHRRDRVWIAAKSQVNRGGCQQDKQGYSRVQQNSERWSGVGKQLGDTNPNATITQSGKPWQQTEQEGREDISRGDCEGGDATNTQGDRWNSTPQREDGEEENGEQRGCGLINSNNDVPGWQENWYEVATRFCRVDDGIPNRVDRNRSSKLKALGNAIVPAVAFEIIKAIVGTGSVLPL